MARVTGLDNVHRRLAKLVGPSAKRRVGRALLVGGEAIQREAQISLTTGAVSGKHHTPSAPGTPPNQESGVLGNNIETVQVSTLKVEVSSNAPYAAAQEFGNSRLPERPYMRPAAAKKRKHVARLVARALSMEGI